MKFRATYDNYEDATNTILREAVADKLPDVTFQGLNRQALLVEKGIAKSLEPFIAKEGDISKDGYHQAMLDLGTFNGKVYGLPFAVSLPVGYYNMDALKKAGITKLPTTWDEVVENCKKLRKAGYKNPLFWGWNITGNWFFQALMWSQGAPIVKDAKVNFHGPEGLAALETMKKLFRGCNMLNLPVGDAGKPFAAGEVAMHFWSTSAVGAIERTKGDFELKTGEFPGMGSAPKGLPAGGNAAMLVSTSKDPGGHRCCLEIPEVHHIRRWCGGCCRNDRLHASKQGRQRIAGRVLQKEPEQAYGRSPGGPAAGMDRLSRQQEPRGHSGDLRPPGVDRHRRHGRHEGPSG